jgi:hypothetical protein
LPAVGATPWRRTTGAKSTKRLHATQVAGAVTAVDSTPILALPPHVEPNVHGQKCSFTRARVPLPVGKLSRTKGTQPCGKQTHTHTHIWTTSSEIGRGRPCSDRYCAKPRWANMALLLSRATTTRSLACHYTQNQQSSTAPQSKGQQSAFGGVPTTRAFSFAHCRRTRFKSWQKVHLNPSIMIHSGNKSRFPARFQPLLAMPKQPGPHTTAHTAPRVPRVRASRKRRAHTHTHQSIAVAGPKCGT